MRRGTRHYKIYRRFYPESGWKYKAVSKVKDDREIILYDLKSRNGDRKGVEVYQGMNYDPNSQKKSFSRNYEINKVPTTLSSDVRELKKVFRKTRFPKRNVN